MSEIRDLLRAADGGPPGHVDHDEIRRRGRRLVAARVAGIVGVVVAVSLAGGLALRLTGDGSRPPVIEQPSPEPAPSAEEAEEEPDGDGEAGFVPPTRVANGQRVVTLRFPGGAAGEIAYPTDIDVHERGATPGAELAIAGDEEDVAARSYGAPRLAVPLEFHLGARDVVLRELNGGDPPELVAEYPGPEGAMIPLYATAAGDYLAWEAGGWTLLLRDPTGSAPGVEPREPEENRRIYAANVHVGEDADGWPLLSADPPVRVRVPAVVIGDPEADHLVVRASACLPATSDADVGPGTNLAEEPGPAQWCDPATQLWFEVVGSADFVESLAVGLEGRASEYPPDVIDPSWVPGDAKGAWQAEHGDGTWVVGYFTPPGIWDHDFEDWPEVMEPRWKRISDDDLGLGREAELREALDALTGPPPPHLGNAWKRRGLQLASARLDGSELVLDFDVLLAAGPGSSGGALMGAQFDAVAFHYYPEADSICVLVKGEPSVWLHDALTCPSRDVPS